MVVMVVGGGWWWRWRFREQKGEATELKLFAVLVITLLLEKKFFRMSCAIQQLYLTCMIILLIYVENRFRQSQFLECLV